MKEELGATITRSTGVPLDLSAGLRLVILAEGRATTRILPKHGSLTLGRSSFCDIQVDHPSVSRQHATLHLGESMQIEDLGARNGIHVRSARMASGTRMSIATGDSIHLGDVMLVVEPNATLLAPSAGSKVVLEDAAMRRLYASIDRIAPSDLSVLITGETGVGKELVAEYIHSHSSRAKGPLVAINCAALSETLLETELFGHEKGAFTGAIKAKTGLIESASTGTVFLDELGEMPLTTQAKLLRVIETRKVLRVGDVTPRDVDVRFIAATHCDLEADIAAKKFRQDLYFRLSGAVLVVPPLRERRAEIEPLARTALAAAAARIGPGASRELTHEALDALTRHRWPGNVRELFHAIERAALLADGQAIGLQHLSLERMKAASPPSVSAPAARVAPLENEIAKVEREAILRALDESGGNQKAAALVLGISRRTLSTRMDEYDIARPRKRSRTP